MTDLFHKIRDRFCVCAFCKSKLEAVLPAENTQLLLKEERQCFILIVKRMLCHAKEVIAYCKTLGKKCFAEVMREMTDEQNQKIEQLYTEFYNQLLCYAKSTLRNEALAEEAVQDAFRIACMKPDEVCGCANPKSWLLKTLRYIVYNMVRCQARANRMITMSMQELDETPNAGGDNVNLDVLYGNLAETEEFRIICGVAEGKSMLELAEEREISISACKKRVQRARRALQRKFRA